MFGSDDGDLTSLFQGRGFCILYGLLQVDALLLQLKGEWSASGRTATLLDGIPYLFHTNLQGR